LRWRKPHDPAQLVERDLRLRAEGGQHVVAIILQAWLMWVVSGAKSVILYRIDTLVSSALMRVDNGAACDLFITLVHGTWPRSVWRDVFLTPFYGKWPSRSFPKSLWFADGSEFRNRLTAALSKRGLSAQISPFLWSGANSVQERDTAARELVEHIRAKQSDHPSSTQVVIAHSHGGNVALRALDQLGVTRNEIFIATIATPFVEILRTKLSPTDTARVDVMVSATTAILVPQYVVHARYTFSPR
jgi:hypothetical protein